MTLREFPQTPRAQPRRGAEPGLRERGYGTAKGVFTAQELAGFAALARRILRRQEDEAYRRAHRSIGSLFDLLEEPEFIELLAHRALLAALRRLGCADPRFEHGIVFNKLPGSPRTFWHQDGTTWNHPSAYDPQPQEVIAIVYLEDTSPHNGCLRVIPESHRRRHALHTYLADAQTPELRRAAQPDAPAYRSFPDEVDVDVRAGDLVVLDARLLHAAHANDSERERTALSLWYAADPGALPECVRARFTRRSGPNGRLPYLPADWPAAAARRLQALLPPLYAGSAEPLPMCNTPGEELR